MDDKSPDDVASVVRSLSDDRIRHIANPANIGHLRNYNKGIGLATGRYVWLISADDRLRSTSALRTFVDILDQHQSVGFAFCPAVGLKHGTETGVLEYSWHGNDDAIFDGRVFLEKLIKRNSVVAASGIVRRDCYSRLGGFPLDMPYAGDWYIWCLISLYYDVAYIAEPMVNYRTHDLSMTRTLSQANGRLMAEDDLLVLLRIAQRLRQDGLPLARVWDHAFVERAALWLVFGSYGHHISYDELRHFVSRNAEGYNDAKKRFAAISALAGDQYYWKHCFDQAVFCYRGSILENPYEFCAWLKYLLLLGGSAGISLRRIAGLVHRAAEQSANVLKAEVARGANGI